MTYEELIYPTPLRHCHQQTFGKDEDTILLLAIQSNATILALDIIRIEYNTVCDLVSRYHELKNTIFASLICIGNKKGVTPFVLAAQKGNLVVVQELLRCCSNGVLLTDMLSNGATAMLQAAHFGHHHVMEHILEYYHLQNEAQLESTKSWFWPKSSTELIDKPSRNGTTPLMRAAQEGHLSAVQLLLQHGAAVYRLNNVHMSSLMLAAQRGHAEICRQLIDHGADLDGRNKQGSTALLLACKRGHVAVVKELVTAFCDLHATDKRNRTALQIVQRRIQRHHQQTLDAAAAAMVIPPPPPQAQNRQLNRQSRNRHRRTNRNNRDHDNENRDDNDIEGDADTNSNLISIRADRKLLHLLNPETQIELQLFSMRVKRNYEMIRIHTLIHQNRVEIKIKSNERTYNVPITVEWLTKIATTDNVNDDSYVTVVPSIEHSQWQRRNLKLSSSKSSLDGKSTHILIRTMLLPAPLIQTIALFLPHPRLWKQRIDLLQSSSQNPNITIVFALDILDEILEDGGLLSAFATAKIPAPTPHRSWCDWKRTAKPKTRNSANISLNNLAAVQQPRNITESLPPSPQDETNPTICELRRLAGYLPLISKYQSSTDIIAILTGEPYCIDPFLVQKLLLFADVASICRRCCIDPLLLSTSTVPPLLPPNHHVNPHPIPDAINQGVHFPRHVASNMVTLAIMMSEWCLGRRF